MISIVWENTTWTTSSSLEKCSESEVETSEVVDIGDMKCESESCVEVSSTLSDTVH